MNTTTYNSIDNAAQEAKVLFYKAIDFLYGTPARTNRTLVVVMASVIGIKILDVLMVVPYCSV
ncbi:MAG: hypothetical protein P8P30_08985 [Rickettsiales bacterium]|nr:hypothetical protein [Rickettsiales bacterium]